MNLIQPKKLWILNPGKYSIAVQYIILLILIYIPVFGYMESVPIQLYDESRLANNAYEMYHDGDLVVTHFEGKPDMWNTKPPLMIWFQVFFMKLFGDRELSVRLPSALGAFLTCLTILFFSVRYAKDFWYGFIAIVVLVSAVGYINHHAVRTGDYDALLTLFTTLYCLSFFIFVETNSRRFLYLTFIAIILAALTKGIGGMFFIPALMLYSIIRKKFLPIVKSRDTYIGIALFLFVVVGYYLLRENHNPGYIKAVWANELGGRYFETIEGHKAEFWFYYKMLVKYHFPYWCLILPVGVLVGFLHPDQFFRKLTWFLTLMVGFYFLVISFGQTKLEWYTVPMYPFLAMIVAIAIHFVFGITKSFFEKKKSYGLFKVMPYVLLIAIFIHPYSAIARRTIKPRVFPWDEEFYRIDYYLKDAIKGQHNVNGYNVLLNGVDSNTLFYIRVLRDKGVDISAKFDWMNLTEGEKAIVHQKGVHEYIELNFEYDVVARTDNIALYRINKKKRL
jgi:4-amino-4-deoxy-L-arabinose transferase-like glycosyltransferase